VTLANSALVGGHVKLGDRSFIGGGAALHQWMRVGRLAIISGNEAISHDVPPFAAVRYRGLKGYNAIGCRRSGMSRQSIHAIRSAYRCIHSHRTVSSAVSEIRETVPLLPEIAELLDFIESTHRGILHSVRTRHSVTHLYVGDVESVAANEDESI
jgi:UDP-N-acetylglucosamine acyltransferase